MSTHPQWRKSSHSQQGDCVEVATNIPGAPMIRDSKLGDESPILILEPAVYAAFIEFVKKS